MTDSEFVGKFLQYSEVGVVGALDEAVEQNAREKMKVV